ncbi:hypothetical protein MKW94_017913 [Papaver nudicaule]|uniref:Kinesin motor domain-containing protein n=1 Tax=Papaver nudicaule TaxID=74823 RepID=A0AA41V8W2_PAPNU|nr:hypothetical protein [Papaver nudicaule]
MMESRKSVRNLAQSIHSLLGLKKQLTSNWAESVCNIIKDISTEEPFTSSVTKSNSSENQECDVGSIITKIGANLDGLNAQLNQLNAQRKQTLNELLDLKGNIRVFCRIRPLIEEKIVGYPESVVALDSSNVILKLGKNKSRRYSFDKVFNPGSSQDEVFSEVEPVIKSAVDGYNACIFAYGQTGTGKTFTMEGNHDCPGIVPRAIEELFKQAADSNHTFHITFSMLEIYMGHLRDLLVPQQMRKPTDLMTQSLSIQTDPCGGVEIENLVEIRVSDFNQANKLYGLGSRLRSTASTNSNPTSSRSHCLIRISLTSFDATERRRETNKIWMVDLGGSERVLKTRTWGRRFEEGKAINLSLSALGDVISALQRRRPHVPFRNSKLTQVLKDSLGEDSRTLMLVHVSPKEDDLCETVCSLGFATRVRNIHLGSHESTDTQGMREVAMANLLEEMKRLENDRQDVKKDIKKLNEELGQLTMTKPPCNEHLEALHRIPETNDNTEKKIVQEATVAPSSQLPTFMRPTICSKRRSGVDFTKGLQKKNTLSTRKRKPLSTRAESLCFPTKDASEYGSECSIARTTCLADYETEYSHTASECDIKTVVLPEQGKPKMGFARSEARNDRYESTKAGRIGLSKCLTVENWLQLHNNEPTTYSKNRGNKRVLAIPLPDVKNRCSDQTKIDILHQDEHNQEFAEKEYKIDKTIDLGVIDDDIVTESNTSSPYSKLKVMDKIPSSFDDYNRFSPTSPLDILFDKSIQIEDYYGGRERLTEDALEDIENLGDNFMKDRSRYNTSSDMDKKNNINRNRDSTEPVSKSAFELENLSLNTKTLGEDLLLEIKIAINQKVQTEDLVSDLSMTGEECEEKDLHEFPPNMELESTAHLHTIQSQGVLNLDLNDDAGQENSIMSAVESQENSGILHLLGQKVKILRAIALLGLGIQTLGLEHDFFYGLMQ